MPRFAAAVLAVVALFSPSLQGQAPVTATPLVANEVPVTAVDFRAERAQNSPMLAIDPTNRRFVVAASRVDGPSFDCQLHVSGSGGNGWVPVRPVPTLPAGTDRCYAPEVGFDRKGRLYYLFVGLRGRANEPTGAFITTSSDHGRNFTTPRRVLGPGRYMVRLAIDARAGARGRLHLVWVEPGAPPALGGFTAAPNRILAAYSDDGGEAFSPPVPVSEPGRSRVVAPAVAFGRKGEVHVAYYDFGDDAIDYQGLEGPTWAGTWSVVVSTSDDGGGTFVRHAAAAAAVVPTERVMLVFTTPPPAVAADGRGRVYVSWSDGRSGDWDVLLSRTFDGGRSWSAAARVNDDPPASGRHQYLPRLAVAPSGRIDAAFYDRRDDPRNIANDVRLASSTDEGATFGPSVKVTSESSDTRTGARYPIPSALNLTDFGSRLALASTDGASLVAWTDTRVPHPGSLQQDVYSAVMR